MQAEGVANTLIYNELQLSALLMACSYFSLSLRATSKY